MNTLPPPGPPGKPSDTGQSAGLARRDAAHARAEADHGPTLLFARRMMALHLLEFGTCTADVVQDLVELPPLADPRLLGGTPKLFAKRGWITSAGYVRTSRKVANARPVNVWRLVDAGALTAWLAAHPMPQPAGVSS